jgi:signal transduction histidine kinase
VTPNQNSKRLEFLRAITNKSILRPIPVLSIILLTTLVHVIGSADLGYRNLEIRVPLAVISILPLFIFIKLSQLAQRQNEKLYFALVLFSYFLGGIVRGAIIENLLINTGLLQVTDENFRILAGMMIVTTTCLFVSYSWSMIENARTKINELKFEAEALKNALKVLQENSDESKNDDLQVIHEKISKEILTALQDDNSDLSTRLTSVVYKTIRPLSKDFAQDIRRWQPPEFENIQLSFGNFWASIDPLKHLKTPVVGIIALVISALASLVAFFDLRNAIEAISAVTVTLLITTFILFRVASRFFSELKSPLRDVVITLLFIVVSLPAVMAQRLVLADTDNPNIFVVATIVAIPIVGWLILTGSAALALTRSLTQELTAIRDDIQWAVARINLLNWYRKGLISRLLHGPIQNSVQVALLRLKSADENKSSEIISEVIQRIDRALQEILDPQISAKLERQTLEEISETWKGIAEISLRISQSCQEALRFDPATATIVTDLLQEICSNAIRHSEAKKIQILANFSDGAIDLEVMSDSKNTIQVSGEGGLGTQFLNSCSIEWRREIRDEAFQLSLKVPTSYKSRLMFTT